MRCTEKPQLERREEEHRGRRNTAQPSELGVTRAQFHTVPFANVVVQ